MNHKQILKLKGEGKDIILSEQPTEGNPQPESPQQVGRTADGSIRTSLDGSYLPTPAEQALLEVLFNPAHSSQPITEICKIANISRQTYYESFGKETFVTLYLQKCKDLIANSIHGVILASVKNSNRAEGFNDRKLLLEMGKAYIPQTTHEIIITEGNS